MLVSLGEMLVGGKTHVSQMQSVTISWFGESEFSWQNGSKFALALICYFNFFMPPYGVYFMCS